MPLSLITPTRQRWHWLREQAEAVSGQLGPGDRWIIAVDNDRPDEAVINHLASILPIGQIAWLHAAYDRSEPLVAGVNRLRNAATALAPARHDIVEVDDHDLLAPYALAEMRAALAAGYDYVFGWYHQRAVIDPPKSLAEGRDRSVGNGLRAVPRADARPAATPRNATECVPYRRDPLLLDVALTGDSRNATECVPHRGVIVPWPDVEHRYVRGAFERREIEAIGVRAFKRWLWTRLGGWSANVWPGGDYHFALRAEAIGAKIICLEQPLCTVTIDPESIAAENR